MSGELELRTTGADHTYKNVQRQLKLFAAVLDEAVVDLEGLRRSMQGNASRTYGRATAIENAGLDPRFVEMTNAVSVALGGAAVHVRRAGKATSDAAAQAHQVQARHARLYSGLDEVRSGRRERTPKPGFFAH